MKTEQEVKEALELITEASKPGKLSPEHDAMASQIYACLIWVLDMPHKECFDRLISGMKEGLAEVRERN